MMVLFMVQFKPTNLVALQGILSQDVRGKIWFPSKERFVQILLRFLNIQSWNILTEVRSPTLILGQITWEIDISGVVAVPVGLGRVFLYCCSTIIVRVRVRYTAMIKVRMTVMMMIVRFSIFLIGSLTSLTGLVFVYWAT